VKLPLLTSFFGGILLFAGCAYGGYQVAVRTVYHQRQSKWFTSLGTQEADRLRRTSQTAFAYSISVLLLQNSLSSVQNNVSSLGKIRATAPEELWPIFDLRLALDYTMMARLEEQANNAAAALGHKRLAADLLRSLGWRDVSDNSLAAIADKQFRSRIKR
jgi:hypothetical protein